MTTATYDRPSTSSQRREPGVFARTESWLDERGKGAWIVAMVLGFIVFWPIGLALLAYMIWSKRMFSGSCSRSSRRALRRTMSGSTGNAAFDRYRDETLQRLEDERREFEAFLQRLREAKDKAEFDQFMADRAQDNGEESQARPV